jgi:hypothetical protein
MVEVVGIDSKIVQMKSLRLAEISLKSENNKDKNCMRPDLFKSTYSLTNIGKNIEKDTIKPVEYQKSLLFSTKSLSSLFILLIIRSYKSAGVI